MRAIYKLINQTVTTRIINVLPVQKRVCDMCQRVQTGVTLSFLNILIPIIAHLVWESKCWPNFDLIQLILVATASERESRSVLH